MTEQNHGGECRYFLTYSGVKLPLKLVSPISEADTRNRNTFMRAFYDSQDQLIACEKVSMARPSWRIAMNTGQPARSAAPR